MLVMSSAMAATTYDIADVEGTVADFYGPYSEKTATRTPDYVGAADEGFVSALIQSNTNKNIDRNVVFSDAEGAELSLGTTSVGATLCVREGTLVIKDSTITKQAVTGNKMNLQVGGTNAALVLDNSSYSSGVKNTNDGDVLHIGGHSGKGSITLQNNSTMYTTTWVLIGLGSKAGYTNSAGYFLRETTDATSDVYKGEYRHDDGAGTAFMRDVDFGTGSLTIMSGSEFKVGGYIGMRDGSITVTGVGSKLSTGVDSHFVSKANVHNDIYADMLGRGSGANSYVRIEKGGVWNAGGHLVSGTMDGYESTVVVEVDGEGSALNVAKTLALGYGTASGRSGAVVSSVLAVTNGGAVNAGNISFGVHDGKVGSNPVYVYVDEKSTMSATGTITVNEPTKNIYLTVDDDNFEVKVVNDGTVTANKLVVKGGEFVNNGTLAVNSALTLNGGKLSLGITSQNLTQASVSALSFDGQSGVVELRALENLKAGKYHIMSLTESAESGEAPAPVAAAEGGVQYTLIGFDGLETVWEGGDLYLTLDSQLIVSRDPLSDAMMAANWGVYHSSQAFTGTLWAPRTAASCTQVDGDKTAWATAYSSFVSQNDADKFKGADYSIYGASMGVETPFGKNRIIGVAFGYDMGKASLPNTTDIEQTSCHVAAYGRAAVWCFGEQGNLALDWSAAYGSTTSEHDAEPGDWTQDSFQLDARATYSRSLSTRTSVSAFFGAQYYSQDSASTARSQADAIKNFRLMLGTGIQRAVTDNTTVFGEATLRQDVVRDNPNVMVDGFRYGTGANPGRFGGSISAGVEHKLNDDWKVRANYSFEVADDQNVHSFGAGASYSF